MMPVRFPLLRKHGVLPCNKFGVDVWTSTFPSRKTFLTTLSIAGLAIWPDAETADTA
jgi:hypothetical protein